jgi:50S ribosomal protein L16 3-hydroxylase
MLKLPGTLTAESFLARYWQKEHLFMPEALPRVRPSISRNELGWLATLEDVESRLVFTERSEERLRYVAETGPFDSDYLTALPQRDWTLLVHDVEKHLPAMRKLFAHVPFIPDWRIDDLMVSFAAPGGGVGPHRDNYDVFLCQGVGVREWHVSSDDIAQDSTASDDLALTVTFEGETHEVREGDVLYLPPGVAHWGTARRACITYSIGMRAPQLSDLADELPDVECENPFFTDADLALNDNGAGFISTSSVRRAMHLLHSKDDEFERVAVALGRFVTETKDWITPETLSDEEAATAFMALKRGARLDVHGMARIAHDERNLYVNGRCMALPPDARRLVKKICANRQYSGSADAAADWPDCLTWMLKMGTFEIPEDL